MKVCIGLPLRAPSPFVCRECCTNGEQRPQCGRESPGEAQIKEDFVTGFIKPGETHKGEWMGRQVDVIVGPEGAVYISDDAAGVIYRVSPK